MSPLVLSFLESAAAPGAAAAVLFFILGIFSDPLRARLQGFVLAFAFAAGSYVLVKRLSFPPYDINEAFTWGALALAVFVALSPRSIGSRYAVRALFTAGLGLLALWPIRNSLHGYTHMRNLLAFFFLGLGTWSILEKAAQSVQALTLTALPLISATALSLMLLFKGSASMAQLVSVLCAVLGGVCAVTLLIPRKVSAAAVIPFVSVFIVMFMASGHFYLEINPWHMIYLCPPFLVLWIRRGIPFLSRQPVVETLTLGFVSGAPVAYFLWKVYQSSGPLY